MIVIIARRKFLAVGGAAAWPLAVLATDSEVADHRVLGLGHAFIWANGSRPAQLHTSEYAAGAIKNARDEERWMLDQLTARLRRFLGKAREGHEVHAPFRVTTHRGHTVQTFQSLELALEAAEALGPDHYVVDRHGLQIWNQQRKLLRNEE